MFIKLFKSIYFKPALFLMALAMLTMSFTMPGGTVVLKAGTVIPMELVNTITSKTARSGQLVDFRVTSDVKVDGKTVVAAGSIAQGQIEIVENLTTSSENLKENTLKLKEAIAAFKTN